MPSEKGKRLSGISKNKNVLGIIASCSTILRRIVQNETSIIMMEICIIIIIVKCCDE